ncbi:MAG: hypothetical protein JWM26_4660, partial [Betaproteobacteria bacterium]|nr:hypothetical protein [Betaproteobacteria bacterium]
SFPLRGKVGMGVGGLFGSRFTAYRYRLFTSIL